MTGGRAADRVAITGVRLFDPGRGVDAPSRTVLVEGDKIASLNAVVSAGAARIVNAHGLVLSPGFIDLRAHLYEPGFRRRETIASGVAAAARGGFTTVVMMPTTEPPIDRVDVVELILSRARAAGATRVWPAGTLSVGREGKRLSEMSKLCAAGCVAFTDGDRAVRDSQLLRYALQAAGELGVPILTHAEDELLSLGGVMHEGIVSARLGLRGVPGTAEAVGVARDIAVAALTGARLHIGHVSTAEAVDLIRQAKKRAVRVTADVSPLHLWLTDEACGSYDTRAKVFPPLRPREDVDAVISGLADGTIDAVASDHNPQTDLDKNVEFDGAAPGAIGLESAFGVVLSLIASGKLTLERAVATLTRGPATVLGRPDIGRLTEGGPADLVVFDPRHEWTFDATEVRSRSKSSPLLGTKLRGKVVLTMAAGRVTYEGAS